MSEAHSRSTKDPINVLFVAQGNGFAPATGGSARHLTDIAYALARLGHKVTVATGPTPGSDINTPVVENPIPNLRIYRLPSLDKSLEINRRGITSLSDPMDVEQKNALIEQLEWVIQSERPQIIHGHDAHRRSRELTAALFALNTHIPIINTIHTPRDTQRWKLYINFPWDHQIVISPTLLAEVPTNHARFIPAGIDCSNFHPTQDPSDLHPEVMEMGPVMFIPSALFMKGFDLAFQAFELIKDEWPDLKLLVSDHAYGAGEPPASDEFAAGARTNIGKAGLSHRVIFTRFDPSEMPAVYRAVEAGGGVFIHPSRSEGFGLAPQESMACGLPPIVSDIPGHSFVQHERSGLVVPLDDPPALANAVLRMRDPALRAALRMQAIKDSEKFDINSYVIPQLLDLYQALVNEIGRRFTHPVVAAEGPPSSTGPMTTPGLA